MTPYFLDYGVISGVRYSSDANQTYEYDTTKHKGVSYDCSTSQKNIYANKYVNTENKERIIKSITTYCEVPESNFKIYISSDGTMEGLNAVKIKNAALSSGYTSKYMGYLTIDLENPIKVDGDFTVAIEVTNNYGIYDTIPQDINYTKDFQPMGRCFAASDIGALKTGNYIDCGSNSNIIKVHTDFAEREWKFDDGMFDGVKLKSITEETIFDSLTINPGIAFQQSKKSFKGTYLNNYALLYKTTDKNKNSIVFPVNGDSNIYFVGKSNDEVSSRRLAIYSEASGTTEYITMNNANGYEYKYRGNAGKLYVYSVDDKIRLYEIAVRDYDENEFYPIDEGDELVWDFSDVYTYGTKISKNIEINKMKIFATQQKPVTVSQNGHTTNEGYRPSYMLNLEGSGNDDYRTIAVPVMPESDVYIMARTTSTNNTEMYLTNKYYCNINSNLNSESITITPEMKAYKFEYYGDGEIMYIRSKNNNIRMFSIVEKPREVRYYKEHKWIFDNMQDLSVGSVITDGMFDELNIISKTYRPATVVNSSSSGFSKAIELTSDDFLSASKIAFNVCDSRGTSEINPVRKIRVKAKTNDTRLKLVLGDKYGYVIGAYPLSNSMQEYVFEYKGAADTLYLFTYYEDEHSKTEIYSISTSDVDYETDAQTISLIKNGNNQGRCILSVSNIPATGVFNYILTYNMSELSFNSIDLGKDDTGKFLTGNNITVVLNSPGHLIFRIKDVSKQNWSGLIASVTFDFLGSVRKSNITFSAKRVYDLD